MHELYELKEMLCKELEEYGKKGELSAGTLEIVDKLAHAAKNLGKLIEMYEEEEEYSGAMGGRRYNRYSREGQGGGQGGGNRGGGNRGGSGGGSYARGRGRNANRDSMGRYSSDGYSREGYSRDGYSYAEDGVAEMIEEMREMMQDLPQDKQREVQKFIQKMEQM